MNLNFFQWHSLKTRVTFLTLAIFLAAIWSLSYSVSRMLRVDMQRMLGEQQFSTASFAAAGVNDALEERLVALELVAQSLRPAMLHNPATLRAVLENRPVLQHIFNGGVIAHDLDGVAIVEVPLSAGRIGINFADRDFVIGPLKEGKATIGRPVIGKKSPAPFVSMGVPIHDAQGKVIGSLTGVTNLTKPNFLDKLTVAHYGRTGNFLLVASQYRQIVTASDKRRIMEILPAPGDSQSRNHFIDGYEGTDTFINARGVEVLASAKGVPAAGWYVAVGMPTEEAFAPIRAMQMRILAATIFLTLLLGGLTWWMLRRQLSPLMDAMRSLAAQSDTNQPLQPLPIANRDEIGRLIGGFNRLLEIVKYRDEAYRESESRSRAILDASPVPLAIIDERGNFAITNDAFVQAVGYTMDDISTASEWWLRAYPDPQYRQRTAKIWLNNLEEANRTGSPFVPMDADVTCKDDSVRSFIFVGAVMGTWVDGYVLVAMHDVTERNRTQAGLRTMFRAVEQSPTSILITDSVGNIEYVNPRFVQVTGYTVAEVFGKNPRILKSNMTSAETYKDLWKIISAGGEWRGELCNRRKNGELFWESVAISGLKEESGEIGHFIAVKEDITMRKQSEAELDKYRYHLEELVEARTSALKKANETGQIIHRANAERLRMESDAKMESRKLEAMGTLAAGIAHDFNNILGSIVGFAEMTADDLPDESSAKHNIGQILIASFRARDLVARMLDFARQRPVQAVAVDIEAQVREALALLRASLPPSVNLSFENCMGETSAAVTILADPTQIQQLVMNLCINAAQAMDDRGTIRVAIDPGGMITGAPPQYCDGICVTVADSGSGMTPEVLERMFDPFFTTKAPGRGTGLGLSVVYGIVTALGGVIEVNSRVEGDNAGTEFRVFLPLAKSQLRSGELDDAHLAD